MSQIPTKFDSLEHPHRRRNALTGDWVLISPHRTKRPWQGQVEAAPADSRPTYDPSCYLCPGNERAGGKHNLAYSSTFVFDNDFAALLPDGPRGDVGEGPLFQSRAETGICRVICFSPRHDLTLPEMESSAIRHVVDIWAQQTEDLGSDPHINYVQIFENKGEIMGCSNPHPHGQIWSNYTVPEEPAKEDASQRAYVSEFGTPLLLDYVASELAVGDRIVVMNDFWVALVPFWAVWPFETILIPRRHVVSMPELTDEERDALAEILKRLLTRYDNLFEVSFPYSMGWHGQPTDGMHHPTGSCTPTFIRRCSVQPRSGNSWSATKCLPCRSVTLQQSKRPTRLRQMSDVHYKRRSAR